MTLPAKKPVLSFKWVALLPLLLSSQSLHQQSDYVMGTLFHISVYHQSAEHAHQAISKALETLHHYDQVLSDYNPKSELNQALKALRTQKSVPISPLLFEALHTSAYYHDISQGFFDIRTGALMQRWGFKNRQFQVPDPGALRSLVSQIQSEPIELQTQPLRMSYATPQIQLDFGAIGKGMALDAATHILKSSGITSAALDCRSTQSFLGAPPGAKGWKVALKQPGQTRPFAFVYLNNQAISTSGVDEHFFKQGGKSYGHILNPHTGYPEGQVTQTHVIAPSATESDALSTVAFLTPAQTLKAIQNRHQGVSIWRYTPQKMEYFPPSDF